MATYERKLGRRDGIRWAITWLHERAKAMNDDHAKIVLDSAAHSMGVELKSFEVVETDEIEQLRARMSELESENIDLIDELREWQELHALSSD